MSAVASSASTHQRYELALFFDSSAWEGTFDRVEVWRSRGTAQGPYEPLHDDSWMPARLPLNTPGDPPSPAQTGPSTPLNGTTLQFLVNEVTPVNITFSGTDPFTFAQAAAQIIAQGQGLVTAFALNGVLVVQTMQAGLQVTLRCVGGTAAPLLGLATVEPGSLAFGRDARIVLVQGQENYSLVDPNGSFSFFYQARFFKTVANVVSEFSTPFQGRPLVGLPTSGLCRVYVNLVDLLGNPLVNQEVLIHNKFNGQQVAGNTIVGTTITLLTDVTGHAEALLARGSSITVAITGTSLARDVVVPTDTTIESIDLLGPGVGSNDLFTVQVPNIPYAVRRSL